MHLPLFIQWLVIVMYLFDLELEAERGADADLGLKRNVTAKVVNDESADD